TKSVCRPPHCFKFIQAPSIKDTDPGGIRESKISIANHPRVSRLHTKYQLPDSPYVRIFHAGDFVPSDRVRTAPGPHPDHVFNVALRLLILGDLHHSMFIFPSPGVRLFSPLILRSCGVSRFLADLSLQFLSDSTLPIRIRTLASSS